MNYQKVVFEFLKKRDGNFCYYCRGDPQEIDHTLPRQHFPEFEHDMNNLRLVCVACNRAKRNLTPAEYVTKLVLRNIVTEEIRRNVEAAKLLNSGRISRAIKRIQEFPG